MPLPRWILQFASAEYCYRFAGRWGPRLLWPAILLMVIGIYWGLVIAPADYRMGDNYRIMFLHVPAAWLSLAIYVVMAGSAAGGFIWRAKLGDAGARAAAPLGALFTFCALVTGSLWGKPTWGTYWIWDARLTSELILLFLYLGYMALVSAFEDHQTGSRAGALLALVGVINLPIIHYSVQWWNTLHQGSTFLRGDPTISLSMVWPLLIMTCAFKLYFAAMWLKRLRIELLVREQHTRWVATLAAEEQ